jgi:hypothetical protein
MLNKINELKEIILSNNFENKELKKKFFFEKFSEYFEKELLEVLLNMNFHLSYYYINETNDSHLEMQYMYTKQKYVKKILDGYSFFLKNPIAPNGTSEYFLNLNLLEQKEYILKQKDILNNILSELFYNDLKIKNKENIYYFYTGIFKEDFNKEKINNNKYYTVSLNQISFGLLRKIKTIKIIKKINVFVKPNANESKKDTQILTYINERIGRNSLRDKSLPKELLKSKENSIDAEQSYVIDLVRELYFFSEKRSSLNMKIEFELEENIGIYKEVLFINYLKQEGIFVSNNKEESNFYPITSFDLFSFLV